jgi:hypothetical protein
MKRQSTVRTLVYFGILVLIIAAVCAQRSYTSVSASSVSFGQDPTKSGAGASSFVANNIVGSAFVVPQSGIANSITVEVVGDGTTNRAKALIYRADTGAYVGETQELMVGSRTWGTRFTFNFAVQPSLVANTNYLLAFWTPAAWGIAYTWSGSSQIVGQTVTYGVSPQVIVPRVLASGYASIYCTYTPGQSATPTPVPSLSPTPTPVSASSVSFGQDPTKSGAGASSFVANNIVGSAFVVPQSGIANSITVEVVGDGTTNRAKALIYRADTGAYVGETQELMVGSRTWGTRFTFNFAVQPSLVANTNYLLAFWTPAAWGIAYTWSGSSQIVGQTVTYGVSPQVIVPRVLASGYASIYCTYTPGQSATPTPVPSLSPTPTPVSASSVSFGQDPTKSGAGASSFVANNIVGSAFVVPQSGIANSITVEVVGDGTTNRAKALIYRADTGAYVGETQELMVGSRTWGTRFTFNFAVQPSLVANTNYLLAFWTPAAWGIAYTWSGSSQIVGQTVTYGVSPQVIVPRVLASGYASIYCTYTPGQSATPTPVPSLSPTPTPVSASSVSFGQDPTKSGAGASSFVANNIVGSAFVVPQSGIANSITVEVVGDGTTNRAKALIYRADTGAYVGETQELMVGSRTWGTRFTFNFAVQPSLVANTNYLLAFWTPAAWGIAYTWSGSSQIVGQTVTYGVSPQVIVPRVLASGYASIYCMYTPGQLVTPTSTSTPLPTQTVQPSATPTPIPTSSPSLVKLGIYLNSECTTISSSINWGKLTPGVITTLTLYVRNEGTTVVTLHKSISNWNPESLSNYLTLTWNYNDESIKPLTVLAVTLHLTVAHDAPFTENFGFDMSITATSS